MGIDKNRSHVRSRRDGHDARQRINSERVNGWNLDPRYLECGGHGNNSSVSQRGLHFNAGKLMKIRRLLIFALCSVLSLCSLAQQVTVSGNTVVAGNASVSGGIAGQGGGSGPLTYAARTDNCVTGAESGCIGGKTTGETGSAMSFLARATDHVPVSLQETIIGSGNCPSGVTPGSYPASCVAPINSTGIDPDFGASLLIVSDDYINHTFSWGKGGGFTANESLFLITSDGGTEALMNLNPASFHAKTCASSPCVSNTGITQAGSGHGDSTHFAFDSSIAADVHSIVYPTRLFELDNLLVNQLIVTSTITANTGTLVRTLYADFVNGTGSYGGVLPPITVGANTSNYKIIWNGEFNASNGGSLGVPLGGGYDWLTLWTPADSVGNTIFIYPVIGNAAGNAFQATTISGATGASEPTWSTCTTTCTDGSVTWTNIGNLSGGQGPGFDIVQYSPALGYSRINTRLAKIYRGSGNSAPAGLFTTNDPVACTRTLGAPTCGMGVTVNLPDELTLHDGNQASDDRYFTFEPTGGGSNNSPGNWNSGTLTCQNGGASAVWAGAWSSLTTYTQKKTVSYTDNAGVPTTAYYVATSQANNLNQAPSTGGVVNTTYWTQSEAYCSYYFWSVATTLVQPQTAWAPAEGHSAGGELYEYYSNNLYAGRRDLPVIQLSPPNGPITINPGTAVLSTIPPADFHGTYNNANSGDHQPVFAGDQDWPSDTTRYT